MAAPGEVASTSRAARARRRGTRAGSGRPLAWPVLAGRSVQPSAPSARLASLEWQVTRRASAAEPPAGELSTAQGLALLREAAALGVKRALLAGGDPSARGDLPALIAGGASAGLAVHVVAPPLPRALAGALPALAGAGLRGLVAPLHAPEGKGHDAACATPGSFAATVDLLQVAREIGLAVEVRTALLPGRLRGLPAMAQLASAIGVARWTVVAPVGPAPPRPGAPAVGPLGALALERALVTLADLAAAHRFEVAAIAAPHLARVVRMRHGGSPDGPAGRVHVERDGVDRLFVSAGGEVFPSPELPLRIGTLTGARSGDLPGRTATQNNVNSDPTTGECPLPAPPSTPADSIAGECAPPAPPSALAEALAHPVIEALRSGHALTGKCGVCSFRRLCGGSRARAFAATSALWAEDPSCAHVPRRREGAVEP